MEPNGIQAVKPALCAGRLSTIVCPTLEGRHAESGLVFRLKNARIPPFLVGKDLTASRAARGRKLRSDALDL